MKWTEIVQSLSDLLRIENNCIFRKELRKRIHSYTNYKESLKPEIYYAAESSSGFGPGREWAALPDLEKYPMASIYRKLAAEIAKEENSSILLEKKPDM